ncbi:MAG: SagB/ThcOx family dehydrogenase [Betaproteobacteria bacterium]|nr:SagB/ThcOx family dehydrogenase [Betaproteobacteria bacterium]
MTLDSAAVLRAYHLRTKHRHERYADGPGSLDWDAQPDPFRTWKGTRWYSLPRRTPERDIPWSALAAPRAPEPFNTDNLSAFLRLSVAITAWKEYGGNRWALRAHPSSGNLHPTETWIVAYWVEGLADGLYHYQCRDHTVEWRASALEASDQPGLWLGFTSIPWREAWKYGERAFRYCQLDMGHVLAAVAHAAALFGWRARLVDLSHEALAHCLGADRAEDYAGVEAEEAEVMVALKAGEGMEMPPLEWDEWSGLPSLLDPKPMYEWPVIEAVAAATRGPLPEEAADFPSLEGGEREGDSTLPASQVLLRRRSAQAFDGRTTLPLDVFRRVLASLLPRADSPVWRMWKAAPSVHPALLVHRVEGLEPGLYLLPRSEAGLTGLGPALRAEFEWTPADPELPLYRLVSARAERTARSVSCHQDIAAQSAFTLMFIAEFDGPLAENPAAYRHLHWEAGMLGHCATLEAEAAGWRGTGIGCFFDDAVHELLGLTDTRWQVLYHYAIGMAVDDARLLTLPAYE